MSSYEKQMQWKKASTVKAKKDKEDRTAAGESFSFTPVMYTSSSHVQKDPNERHGGEVKPPRSDKSRRESSSRDTRQARNAQEGDLYSPVRGNSSVSSHQNSEAGAQSATGYGNVYSEQLVSRGYDDQHHDGQHHSRQHKQRNDNHGDLDNVEEDDREDEEEHSRPLRPTLSRSNSSQHYERGGGDSVNNRRRSQGSTRQGQRAGHRDSGVALRRSVGRGGGRDSPESSLGGSSGGEDEDEADEPIIELLERERRQWREEREKLIQCIHLQQLELSQRSVAAHERAADIAKEFARAIECFEERLVSVEGTVQKEIMSIKTIAESLLHAAQAQTSPHAVSAHASANSTSSRV